MKKEGKLEGRNMIKVLHIVNGTESGGISAVIRNYYSVLDHDLFHFDLATAFENKGALYDSFINEGYSIYYIGNKSIKNIINHIKALRKIIKDGGYDVLHVHQAETSWVDMLVGRLCGVKILISHAHNADKRKKTIIFRLRSVSGKLLLKVMATYRVACGKDAAVCMYGQSALCQKNLVIIPNAIEIEKYIYDKSKRKQIRRELGISDGDFVIGAVGRMSDEKNQIYILNIIPDLIKIDPSICLLLVGDGEQRLKMEQRCKELWIEDKVIFTGVRQDVGAVLSAMDVFLLPSVYEGFPVSVLEAAANGLQCIISDSVTDELDFLPGVKYVSLSSPEKWVDIIRMSGRKEEYYNQSMILKNNGFDISGTKNLLNELYEGVY